ncbi:STAS domain-containing protein [Actinoplanes sp. KI2]|uniref:STAS domain-containing protein n=1 Tax=Actinoplanes sp. KI2 TaxID=2983315 RepID=UPI0021D5E6FC|nr:STAS domain-containing protein [Actinoplanes sp. KI2]MCU7723048.1 STAS domain-containing protein [Actinoplanes sp. KI2]
MADSYVIGQERAADGSATLLHLGGELDITARDTLRETILAALDDGDVVIDLDAVTFVDSEALGALIEAYQAARARPAGFRVVNAHGLVARVLKVSGVLELFGG